MLREAVKAGTEIGLRAKALMDRGELVSDEVMIGIVKERLEKPDTRSGFILDGFPRTVAQAIALDRLVESRGPLTVLDIEVPEAELVRRLTSRLVCESCGSNAEGVDVAQMATARCRTLRWESEAAVGRQRDGRSGASKGLSPGHAAARGILPRSADV